MQTSDMQPGYFNSTEAAQRLGVSKPTLYSYVSRKLLRAHPSENFRGHRYRVDDIDQLAQKLKRGKNPKEVAKHSLNWGVPIIESTICLIANGNLYYRGNNVLDLIKTHSVEEVAALLWQCAVEEAFNDRPLAIKQSTLTDTQQYRDVSAELALLPMFSMTGAGCSEFESYGNVVRTLAACLLHGEVQNAPLHIQCARAWGVSDQDAALIRKALILCADHELNASTFTVRCIASTDASLHASLIGGLAALSGTRHGGTTSHIELMLNELHSVDELEQQLQARLQRDGYIPGFGHPLYPDGDPRARALLENFLNDDARWQRIAQCVEKLTGLKPTIDFALVVVRRQLQLPIGSAFGLFALGRSTGWIAHAIEQRQQGQLVRPRAHYIGPVPRQS